MPVIINYNYWSHNNELKTILSSSLKTAENILLNSKVLTIFHKKIFKTLINYFITAYKLVIKFDVIVLQVKNL